MYTVRMAMIFRLAVASIDGRVVAISDLWPRGRFMAGAMLLSQLGLRARFIARFITCFESLCSRL